MFWLTKQHYYILAFLITSIVILGYNFIVPLNYEFLIYIFVIIVLFWIIIFTNKKVKYPILVLWLLAIWAFLHMAWGAIKIDWHVLYAHLILPIIDNWEWKILRYDQLIHSYGFFTSTILSYYILKNKLINKKIWFGLWLILIMAWCGFWALNEVIEFIVDTTLPESWVGGYINTWMDLVSNLIWSILAIIFIKIFLEKKETI